jgi:dihydrofolate reductase
MRVVVVNHLSLDGVMQAPARPDEDRRGGFELGGWAIPFNDAATARMMGFGTGGEGGGMLFGRRTYEDFARIWPAQAGNPFTEVLNRRQKYVASTTLREPLPWVNSTLLQGDAAEAVRALKADGEGDLTILGSGALIRSLLPAGLIDEFVLSIDPIVLGSGQRMFPETGPLVPLRLVDVQTSTTGVVVARYQPA